MTASKDLILAELHERVWDGMGGYLPNGRAEHVASDAWERVVVAVTAVGWEISVDGTPLRAESTRAAAALDSTWSVSVSDAVHVNLFPMWSTHEVWFDFDMRELREAAEVALLSRFVRLLGDTLDRPVLLSLEGADDIVFASYLPHTGMYEWEDA